MTEVFKIDGDPALPTVKPGAEFHFGEVTQNVMKGRDEQIYEPSIRKDEDGTGGLGGTAHDGSEEGDQSTSDDEMDLAGVYK